MKMDERYRQRLIENFQSWLKTLEADIDSHLNKSEQATTITELMKIKFDLLIDLANHFPWAYFYCCLYMVLSLGWAKIDWEKILTAWSDFKDALKLYYQNEVYSTEMDESIKEKYLQGLKSWKNYFVWNLEERIGLITQAQTFEEIVKRQKEFLVKYLAAFPLGTGTCYFCLAGTGCEKCEYAKYHGQCKNGDYIVVDRALGRLIRTVERSYIKEEDGQGSGK